MIVRAGRIASSTLMFSRRSAEDGSAEASSCPCWRRTLDARACCAASPWRAWSGRHGPRRDAGRVHGLLRRARAGADDRDDRLHAHGRRGRGQCRGAVSSAWVCRLRVLHRQGRRMVWAPPPSRAFGEGVDVRRLHVDGSASDRCRDPGASDVGPSEVVLLASAGQPGHGSGPYRGHGASGRVHRPGHLAARDWCHIGPVRVGYRGRRFLAVERARVAGVTVRPGCRTSVGALMVGGGTEETLAPLAPAGDVVLGGVEELALVAGLADDLETAARVDPETAADAVLALGPAAAVVKRSRRRAGTPARG